MGLTLSSGNTDSKNVKGTVDLGTDRAQWRHAIRLDALYNEESGTKTGQRYRLSGKSDYKLPANKFLFVAGAYENDEFNAYDYQMTLSLGYGCRLIDRADQVLDVEVGPGYRFSEYKAGGDENEAIFRLAGKFRWDISAQAQFGQTLSVEAGGDATISRSLTSLTTKITDSLSLRAAFEAKHDSGAPAGSDEFDTQTSLSAVYQF